MKFQTIKILTSAIITLFLFSTCTKDDDIELGNTNPIENIELNPIEVTGNLTLPANIAGQSNLSIISGFYSGSAELSTQSSGIWNTTLNDKNVQLVTLMNGEAPIAYTIALPSTASTLTISARSTAIALVYMNPFIVNSDPESFERILDYIVSSANFESLEQKVSANMTPTGLNMDDILSNLGDVIGDVQDEIADYFQDLNIGLDTLNVEREIVSFQLINRRKRWLSVYANRFKDGVKEEAVLFNGEEELNSYELPSDRTNFIVDVFLEELSSTLEIPLNDADSIVISCYGLGKNPPVVILDEWEYGLDAVVNTLYFDFTIELFSVYSGVGNRIAIDLRGRPQKFENIQIELQQIFKTKLIENQAELREFLSQEEYGEFMKECSSIIFDVVSDAENAKLFYDLLKEFGIDKVLANNIIKKVLPALQIAEVANSAVNIGLFFYAITTSEWQTDFKLTSFGCLDNTFNGDVILNTQLELEQFSQSGYTSILGRLEINSENIVDDQINNLSMLACLQRIEGDLLILNTHVSSLYGLHNIKYIENLGISSNGLLTNLDYLDSLKTIGNYCSINDNNLLINTNGLNNLESIGNYFFINDNPNLVELNGMNNLEIEGPLFIFDNNALNSINGFNSMTYGSVKIQGNHKLISIDGFNNFNEEEQLTNGSAGISIIDNERLIMIDGFDNFKIGHLSLYSNPELIGFPGFKNLKKTSSITIKDNNKLETLDDFKALEYFSYEMNISENILLGDFCSLIYAIQNSPTFNFYIAENLFNPSLQNLQNGICN